METYNKPLNLAHQEGRKADRLLEAGKFQESICCHQRAADHLNAALMTTSSDEAKESIQLQREHHLKQQQIIKMKQQHHVTHPDTEPDGKADESHSHREPTDEEKGTKSPSDIAEHAEENKHENAYRTMEECDSLLRILRNRNYFRQQSDSSADTLSANSRMIKSAVKVAKNDKQVIEELRMRNEELAKHVEMLLKEIQQHSHDKIEQSQRIESLEQQNRMLQCKLERMDAHLKKNNGQCVSDSVEDEPFPVHINPNTLSSFKLPPLEVPKFDFDQLEDED